MFAGKEHSMLIQWPSGLGRSTGAVMQQPRSHGLFGPGNEVGNEAMELGPVA